MKQYLDLLRLIKETGTFKEDRTGTGTYSIFGHQMRFDLSQGFPLVTTKKIFLKGIIHELLWFIQGQTNIQYLLDNNVHIWDAWATEEGDLGPVYGAQWRSWPVPGSSETIDQLGDIIAEIKSNPDSRRLIVSAWNPAVLPDPKRPPHENAAIGKQALPPCHTMFQFYVADGKLSCQLYQRSCDVPIGCPFNIASYALLTMMVAQVCNLKAGDFIHTIGDAHIYKNQLDGINQQLERQPHKLPTMKINPDIKNLEDFRFEDFTLENYECDPAIKMPVAV